ncbi:MarR family winged helix-turn-helix transcriptional regulator [Sphingomonas sp. PB4P5]|uniref:MarR family winged helix-turn-helix transcriptional regulator n=1 Tax=Parasphingomonas puruogangriensis TaxID=3096155 RepID=UPI002FC82AFB
MIDGPLSSFDTNISVALIAEPGLSMAPQEAIRAAGGRIILHEGWAEAAEALRRPMRIELLVVETAGLDPAALDDALPQIADQARQREARIVAAIDDHQIDQAAHHLFGRHVHLLCNPTMTERVAALSIAACVPLNRHVGEIARDAEAARLRRLNEEVARIAETLARLTRDDHPAAEPLFYKVDDRRNGYGSPPVEGGVSAVELRQAIRSRRLRSQFFEPSLLEDPAWDMLLDLYAADLERAQVSVSSLCIAAAVAPTTALRWIAKMTEAGLLERQPDPFDRRRAFMALSGTARDGMRGYFAAIRRAGLSIA